MQSVMRWNYNFSSNLVKGKLYQKPPWGSFLGAISTIYSTQILVSTFSASMTIFRKDISNFQVRDKVNLIALLAYVGLRLGMLVEQPILMDILLILK